jgi:hypothetical protein
VKEAILFLISHFDVHDAEFYFEKEKLTRSQWEGIFSECIYNEEVCIFREDGEEYMLIIKKPLIEFRNLTKDYTAYIFPMSGAHGEEVEPGDITYREIMDWIYGEDQQWDLKAMEYIDNFQEFIKIEQALKKHPKKRLYILSKYEDLRNYKDENERHKEFP